MLRIDLICGIIFLSQLAMAQLTLHISSVPNSTVEEDKIYLASHLSNWNPADSNYCLIKNKDKTYQITLDIDPGTLEYKFTRGSWSAVEADKNGQDIQNRVIQFSGDKQTLQLSIEGWKEEQVKVSTAASNVSVLSSTFNIPQLEKDRNIWIYLPPDYEASSKRYPVIYMHDGQNLFDDTTSYSGEWKVDETLNKLFEEGDEGVIIVGIDNGGDTRIEEYTPWANEKFGGGNGKNYINFIVQTLKPYVDSNFRTQSDRLHTGIMGSSLGGLVSFYAAIEYQDVFGLAGIFSPSFWFSKDIYPHVTSAGKKHDMRFYLLGGELEGEFFIQEIESMVKTLKEAGFKDEEIKIKVSADGNHNEQFWAKEFKDCYLWLFR